MKRLNTDESDIVSKYCEYLAKDNYNIEEGDECATALIPWILVCQTCQLCIATFLFTLFQVFIVFTSFWIFYEVHK